MDAIKNFAYSTVATAPSPATTGTSLVLASGEGALFPDPATDGEYNIVVWPTGENPLSSNAEICRVTAISTDTLTITREQEDTTARTIVIGDQVMLSNTKKTMDDIEGFGKVNLIKNGNFINNSTNGYGSTPDDWTNSSANPVQGGFPSFTKQQLIDLLGISDGDIEGLWNLNEASGNAMDLSSNAYHLTDNNTVTSSEDGLMGKARDFENNNSESFTIADASCANLELAGSHTLIAFIKPETLGDLGGGGARIMNKRKGSNASAGYEFYVLATGAVGYETRGLTASTLNSDVSLEAGKCNMVICIYDSANTLTKLWINGVKKQQTASGSIADSNADFSIGASSLGGSDAKDDFYDGLIQNVGVLSVALTDSQVKKLWAFTSYKGQKIRRATSNGALTQTLDEALVERLRGKTVTMRATMWQDTASIGQININDGTDNKSITTTTTGSWVTVSKTITISATATTINLGLEVNTSDGNVWFREVAFYEGSGVAPYSHSPDDWNRFPRLLKMDIPKMVAGKPYQYEEGREYTYTPTFTGFSTSPTGTIFWLYRGKKLFIDYADASTGTSNATGFTFTSPIISKLSISNLALIAYKDNGTNASVGHLVSTANSGVITVYKSFFGGTWTASAGKDMYFAGVQIPID